VLVVALAVVLPGRLPAPAENDWKDLDDGIADEVSANAS
jgi:hypothetical protein